MRSPFRSAYNLATKYGIACKAGLPGVGRGRPFFVERPDPERRKYLIDDLPYHFCDYAPARRRGTRLIKRPVASRLWSSRRRNHRQSLPPIGMVQMD